jgi:hypothetical protein
VEITIGTWCMVTSERLLRDRMNPEEACRCRHSIVPYSLSLRHREYCPESSVAIATVFDGRSSIPSKGKMNIFFIAFTQVPEPTLPPAQREPGALPQEDKAAGAVALFAQILLVPPYIFSWYNT